MADQDVATRAPESDLTEQSVFPGDSAVDQSAATMGVSKTLSGILDNDGSLTAVIATLCI